MSRTWYVRLIGMDTGTHPGFGSESSKTPCNRRIGKGGKVQEITLGHAARREYVRRIGMDGRPLRNRWRHVAKYVRDIGMNGTRRGLPRRGMLKYVRLIGTRGIEGLQGLDGPLGAGTEVCPVYR